VRTRQDRLVRGAGGCEVCRNGGAGVVEKRARCGCVGARCKEQGNSRRRTGTDQGYDGMTGQGSSSIFGARSDREDEDTRRGRI
jgi:hypothetical protein